MAGPNDLFNANIAKQIGDGLVAAGMLNATLSRPVYGDYVNGDLTGGQPVTAVNVFSAKGFTDKYSDFVIASTLIDRADRKITLLGSTITPVTRPSIGDFITIESKDWEVMEVTRDPAAAAYECRCRGDAVIPLAVIVPEIASLVFTIEPVNGVEDTNLTTFTVELRDASNNLIPSDGVPLTLTIVSGTGNLSGTNPRSTASGVATFADIQIDNINAFTLRVTAPNSVFQDSASFTLVAKATQLVITQQPMDAFVGVVISPAITVEVRDKRNVIIATATDSVTASVDTGAGAISGTNPRTAASGIATFNDLTYDTVEAIVKFAFNATGLTGVISDAFEILTAPVLAFDTLPTPNVRSNFTLSGTTTDSGFGGVVTLTQLTGPGITTGTLTTNASGGTWSIPNLQVTIAGVYTYQVTAPGHVAGNSGNMTTIFLSADFVNANSESLTHVDDASVRPGAGSFMWALWVRPSTNLATIHTAVPLVDKWNLVSGTRSFGMASEAAGKMRLFADDTVTTKVATDTTPLLAGVNYFVEGGYDSVNNQIFIAVNRGTRATAAMTGALDTNAGQPLTFGDAPNWAGQPLDGRMDKMAYKDGGLFTSGELDDMYNSGSGREYHELASGTIAAITEFFGLDEVSGTRFGNKGVFDMTDVNTVGNGAAIP